MSARNLVTVSTPTLKSFLNSFDKVICDCDGVVWNAYAPIPGVKETLLKLRHSGKEIYFATNNCLINLKNLQETFNKLEFDVNVENIAYPTLAIIDYFKQIEYKKNIFLIGSSTMRQELTDAGYVVANNQPAVDEDNIPDIIKYIEDDKDIGAVIVDFDFNVTSLKLHKATIYLERPDVMFITGATARKFLGLTRPLIGPVYFQNVLSDFTSRAPLHFGKPGFHFNNYLTKRFNVTDPSRTLFIGDSLIQDIEFATKCGYQKLLVLSGTTSMDQLKNCTDKSKIPDFYIDSLGNLHNLLSKRLNI